MQRGDVKQAFTIMVERDSESKWLVGEVVELPGCSTQAPDIQTLEANVREAIAAYKETADVDQRAQTLSGRGASRLVCEPLASHRAGLRSHVRGRRA